MNTFAKCQRCGKALACFSIEWSNLPDDQKCRCKQPVPPDSPLELLFIWGKALFSEFTQQTEFWRDMPANQLAKCAEALGFRKAFPVLSGLYTPEEMRNTAICRGAVEPIRFANQPEAVTTQTGHDPAFTSDSVGVSSEPPASTTARDSEHGAGLATPACPVPLPLQPFVDAGMNRRNVQAAFGFIQIELEKALGLEEGRKVFRRHWLALPGVFKTREEAKLRTVACWVTLWGYVEAAGERRAA